MSLKFLRTLACVVAASVPMTAQISVFGRLTGGQVVPPTASAGTGTARVVVNENGTATYLVRVSGLTGAAVAAELRGAPAGGNGALIATLTVAVPGSEWRGTTGVLTATQRQAVLTDGAYVVVLSTTSPLGEIRGQLLGVRRWRFAAELDGLQEVPANGSGATATATAWFVEPENVLIYEIDVAGLVGFTVGHLHNGAPGVGGPAIFTLTGTGSRLCGVSPPLAAADVTALKAGNTYLNLHTTSFPGGEIRGQLVREIEQFTFFANGAQEVPANASVHTACGVMTLNPTTNTLTYNIKTTVPALTAMHLHAGPPGVSGPVNVGISGTPPTITGTTVALTAAHLDLLRRGNFYFNLHTTAFPGGEIRGQVRPAADVFGFGATDTAGGPPRIGGDGYVGVGETFDVTLTDATPNQICVLFIGTQELVWPFLATSLPYDAGPFGAPGSFVWTDWDPNLYFNVVTDSLGCARVTFTVPNLPFFECFRFMSQFFIPAPGANPFGFVTSDALVIRIAHTSLPFP